MFWSMNVNRIFGYLAVLLAGMSTATAQPLTIGMITTLSGPAGYLGQDIRDGFNLRIELEGGQLGGVPVNVLVQDDVLKPGQGKLAADKMLETNGVRLFTGIAFSNVLEAVLPDIFDANAIYVGANAAPSSYAGENCNKNEFVIPWQNNATSEVVANNANDLNYKQVFIIVPNYQAGKDAVDGFKRFFKGKIVGEIYTRLDQTDFAVEISRIRSAAPDAVMEFQPGGLGIAFIRQYYQAGLSNTIPMVVSAQAIDSNMLAAVGDAALGMNVSTNWNSDFDNPANKLFVTEYVKKYGRIPSVYASQGYDTALAIGAALKENDGKFGDAASFRLAMLRAKFESIRGSFRFGQNQHPIQDWWSAKIVKDVDGKPKIVTIKKIMSDYGDSFADKCKMAP
jgi:branched-chain amino acid transport system substrate-binding protein